VTAELSSLPRRLVVQAGDLIEIPLPSFAGSGNQWMPSLISAPDIADVAVEIRHPESLNDQTGGGTREPPGAFVAPEVLKVHGLRPGLTRWKITLSRPFAPDPPTAEREIEILVKKPTVWRSDVIPVERA
jgi:hypothetical protein